MLKWLQHIINKVIRHRKFRTKFKTATITELEQRQRKAENELQQIQNSSSKKLSFTLPKASNRNVNIFHARPIQPTSITLKFLAEERARKKHEALLRLEKSITNDFIICENAIKKEKVQEAILSLNNALSKLSKTKSDKLQRQYNELYGRLDELKQEIARREIIKQAEELKRKQEAEERRKAEAERQRQIRVQIEREEQERKRKEQERLLNEARKKEEAEQAEKRRLISLCESRKNDYQAIKALLELNRIRCFYHFTDKRNIASIKKYGGLFSWDYCQRHGIIIPFQGGSGASMGLDKMLGLEDYVRLSFCDDHPMAYRLKQDGYNLVWLKVKIDVAWFAETLFSDINAASPNHSSGGSLNDLKKVDFAATKRNFVSKNDPDFHTHQAEVMVKTFIPIQYIENINNFI